ncbi:gluconokinase [Enterococcus olivae]
MFLGIDIGTTAMKFAVIVEGKIKFQQSSPVTTHRETNGKCYQRWSELLVVLQQGIQTIPKDIRIEITKISFSVAMHSLLVYEGSISDELYLWSDTQAAQTIETFKKESIAEKFYQKTGTPLHAMSPFAKILHFNQQKRQMEQAKYYGIKEMVMYYLTGTFVLDYSTASATGLFDLKKREWDQEILDYLDIQREQLAELVDTTASFPIQARAAEELMLSETVEVVIGASDGCLAAFASYVATGIPNSLTIGTSAAVRRVTDTPIFNQHQNFCYYLRDSYYVIGAPSNNGGCVLEWASHIFSKYPEGFFEELPEMLAESEMGSKGLRFRPFINGERAPLWQEDTSGSFENLRIIHTKADMVRSMVEGILINIRTLTQMVEIQGQLSLSGGFFQSEILRQMTADILGVDCYLSDYNEPILGLYYLIYGQETVGLDLERIPYDPERTKIYQELF